MSTPADADVVFEIHLLFQDHLLQLRLLILDPRSHITLWTLNQNTSVANRDATARKNFDKAVNALVEALKVLVSKNN